MEGLLSQNLATQSMNIASHTRSKFSIESSERALQAEAPIIIAQDLTLIMTSSTDENFETRVQAKVANVIANMIIAGTIPTS